MQKNPCRVDDPLQNPIDRESYEDAVSLEDGIYPITTDDNTIISSDMVKHGSGTVEDALDKAGKYIKLWENPNPTASFGNQNITLSSADYDLVLVIASFVASDPLNKVSVIVPKGSGAYLALADMNNSGANNAYRLLQYINDTTYEALHGYAGTSSNVNDGRLVPVVIYGIKL